VNQAASDAIGDIERGIRRHVDMLAGVIGERNAVHRAGALEAAARYIEDTFRAFGHEPAAQPFNATGKRVRNIETEMRGGQQSERIWIIGAHYDSIDGSPAAEDNASGVAGVLEVARLMSGLRCRDTVRFVTFVNEEPPFYKGDEMGSLVYARRCRERTERIAGMINLEMIGCYSDESGSQAYPPPLDRGLWKKLLPRRGNFIAFVGNLASWRLTWRCRRLFKRNMRFPSWWVPAPDRIDGAGMSDHWSFWEQGYRAVMVTDTAFFRYRHYHKPSDTPEKLDYPRMAKVVAGLAGMMKSLAGCRSIRRSTSPPASARP
jgi:Zn-dependent M28 family amino/carboxypeptidase